jgi:hypothetical protein
MPSGYLPRRMKKTKDKIEKLKTNGVLGIMAT